MLSRERLSIVVLLLRLYLGVALFLPLGIGKLAGFPGSSAGLMEGYRETILGAWPSLPFLYLFSYALPFLETLGGLALVAGWRTRQVFLGLACLLILLGFGTTLDGRIATTANNLIFLAGCLVGYALADDDRYGVSGWRRNEP